ncbi:MAG: dihydropteroate synthase [Rubrivivax sp.]
MSPARPCPAPAWQAGRFRLGPERVHVMGIVNVTPDSFSDGGLAWDRGAAMERCDRLLAEGADLLDIGGESTRPGAPAVDADEELRRVLPVLAHARTLGVPVSVDTAKATVMRAVLDQGADIVNDVRALQDEGALQALAAHASAGVCLMHMQGRPADMQRAPHYDDVIAEVAAFLAARVQAAVAAGIDAARLAVDPGYGFGKTAAHSFTLLAGQARLLALGRPLVAGLSRKSMLGAVTGRDVGDRLPASLAAGLAAVQRGARVLRVHDVAATVDALRVWAALAPPPAP